MSLSPETLVEETEAERHEREGRTGELKTGHMVWCFPNPEDPEVVQQQHRAVCFQKPYAACPSCPHSRFSLFFDVEKKTERLCTLSCPRWQSEKEFLDGEAPDHYVPVEQATCEAKPFFFCPSCPSKKEVGQVGADKTRPGWYGRWSRLTESNDGVDGDS
jgi:hypothetical protein